MLIGDLRKTYFADLLAFLHSVRKTGRLSIVQGTVNKQILFQLGLPIRIESTLPAERFSRFLVERGVLTEEEEARVVKMEVSEEVPADRILLREGLINSDEHRTQVQNHTEKLLYPLFAATEGTYRFEEGLPDLPQRCEPQNFAALVVHGVRQIEDTKRIIAMYGDPGQIPLVTTPPDEATRCLFTDHERAIIEQIDGTRTVKGISRATNLELPVVLKTVLMLSYLGCVSDKVDLGGVAPGETATSKEALSADKGCPAATAEVTLIRRSSPARAPDSKQEWIRSLLGGVDKERRANGEAPEEAFSPPPRSADWAGGDAPALSAQEIQKDPEEPVSTHETGSAGRRHQWKARVLLVIAGFAIALVPALLRMDFGGVRLGSNGDEMALPKLRVGDREPFSQSREDRSAGVTTAEEIVEPTGQTVKEAQTADKGSEKEYPPPGADGTGEEENGNVLAEGMEEDDVGQADGDDEARPSQEIAVVELPDTMPQAVPDQTVPPLVKVKGIHHRVEQDHERIVVDLEGAISFKKYELPEQNIVYVALRQSTVVPRLRDAVIHVSSDIVQTMRLGQFSPEVARLAVTLEKMVNVSVFTVSDPDRIVLVLTDKDQGP